MLGAVMRTYARLPVAFRRGEGVWLFDEDGRRYLDALSGIAVCGLGHAHPAVTAALTAQAGELIHTSNLYRIPHQERLAEALCRIAGMDAAFFCNSGAEANEAAIKLARLHASQRGSREPVIMVMEGAFHGRTLATVTATGSRRAQAGFEPLLPGFVRVPFGDLQAVERTARNARHVCAVLVESIQGEGGIRVPPAGYLEGLRALCDRHDWLLMVDEVQTGMGRTGRWFAFQHENVAPDVVTLAKGLGNGVPIGACLARGVAADVFQPGSHGSTFGGGPLACSAAQAVVDTIEGEGLVQRAEQLGERLRQRLHAELEGLPGVVEIRGRGLMTGIVLDRPCGELVPAALERGLLINVTAGDVVRLLPPLIITEEQLEELVHLLSGLIRSFLQQ